MPTCLFVGEDLNSVLHLGHTLMDDLNDDCDIRARSSGFIHKTNSVLVKFSCTPDVLCYLIHTYCTSFYGCSVWLLSSHTALSHLQEHVKYVCKKYGT